MKTITIDCPLASEARKTYEAGEYEKAQTQANNVAIKIKEEIRKGGLSVSISGSLEPAVTEALKAKGYKVNYEDYDPRDSRGGSCYTTISWRA